MDGPEFDAHEVDFGILTQRNAMYKKHEAESLKQFLEHPEKDLEIVHSCRLEEAHPEVKP